MEGRQGEHFIDNDDSAAENLEKLTARNEKDAGPDSLRWSTMMMMMFLILLIFLPFRRG